MLPLKKEILPRIAGWAVLLQDYDYKLEHRAGNRMRHVDALSRNPISMIISSEFLSRIKVAQSGDNHLKVIKQVLQQGAYEEYFTEHDIVYKDDGKGSKLLCIPNSMAMDIIKTAHVEGHFATKKLDEVLSKDYFIPKLRSKIEKVRNNCIRCILGDKKIGKQEGYLHSIPKNELPLDTYHIDHLGPLSPSVLTKLEQQKSVFGNPTRIISDRGAAFTSTIFKDYCEEEGIQHLLITTGVPRANGQVERINRIIISVLTKLSMYDPSKWYRFTSKLQMVLNSTYQRGIKRSPFEMLTGVKMKNKSDIRIAEAINEEIRKVFDRERDHIREEALVSINQIQKENAKNFNKKRKVAHQYSLNDLVAIKRTQFGPNFKLYPKYLGPYSVTKISPNDRYEVRKVGAQEGPRKTTTCADFMKMWKTVESSSSDDSDEEVQLTNPEEENNITGSELML